MFVIRLMLYAFMIVGAYLLLRRMLGASSRPKQTVAARPVSQLVQDPNCGVYLDVQEAVRRSVGNGQVFFCSQTCADAWMAKKRGA
jgi:YHS domain-containing protein